MKSNQSFMFGGKIRSCVCLNDINTKDPIDIEFSQNGENYIRICGLTIEQAETLGAALLSIRQEIDMIKEEKQ